MLNNMDRYLITQSLLSSWNYIFDCYEGGEEDARASFIKSLHKEPIAPTPEMQNGINFETECYRAAVSNVPPRYEWRKGVNAVASRLRGAQIQVRVSREIAVDGSVYVIHGVLDALKAGVIYDVKYKNKSFGSLDLAGAYRESPQHPFYFYLVPEAYEFIYLVSDGEELYTEIYHPNECCSAAELIRNFIRWLSSEGLLDDYHKYWRAK